MQFSQKYTLLNFEKEAYYPNQASACQLTQTLLSEAPETSIH